FGMRSSVAADALAYWMSLVLASATIIFVYKLLCSKHGLWLAAFRDNETAARALGVDAQWLSAAAPSMSRVASRGMDVP
ncbi:hypothetical protein ACCS72_38605, partial [Rhizobium ruizarguesonis]